MLNNYFKIAVVGSGPSGCFAAQFLLKKYPTAEVYIFDQIPVPYGLLRFGIAADHQGSKNIAQQFDRIFQLPNVYFCGNTTIGKDISFEKLKANFNLIVLATGLENDKSISLTTVPDAHIIGAGALLKGMNTHPDYLTNAPTALGSNICIIGAGNVSMDVVRLLCAEKNQLQNSDINDEYLDLVRSNKIKKINVFSRSSAKDAKFDLSMLKEILALENVQVKFSDDDDVFSSINRDNKSKSDDVIKVIFNFNAKPIQIEKPMKGMQLVVERSSEYEVSRFEADSVITAIGFENNQSFEQTPKQNWNGEFVCSVGWYANGGTGTVAANRKSTKTVIDSFIQKIDKNLETHPDLQIKHFDQDLEDVIARSISFSQWKRIDAYEKFFKPADRCRKKVTTRNLMLNIASQARFESLSHDPYQHAV